MRRTVKDKTVTIETGGSSIVKHKPIFSSDSKYLLCPCGNIIKVFSISTGYCFRRLCGHSLEVTSVQHHPKIKLQVLSSSLDGNVNIWDYEDGVLLSTISIGHPLSVLFCNTFYPNLGFVVQKNENGFQLRRCALDKSSVAEEEVTDVDQVLAKNLPDNVIDRCAFSQDYMAVAFHYKVTVYRNLKAKTKCKRSSLRINRDKDPKITCITCQQSESILATGHSNGEIRIWYNIFEDTPVTNTQHWHSLEVLTLCFTPRGSSLLSGGHECVLVQWSADQKNFLPRLGSPISGISVSSDNSLYACCHSDNSITIVSSYFTIKQVFEGFAAANSDLSCGLQYNERFDACVTNGKPGHLLFYQPTTDTQLYNLDVIGQNFISSADLEKPLSQTKITKLDFCKTSTNDHFMSTLEFNDERKCDQKLKFWKFDESEQQWTLNTVVSSPHGDAVVTSLAFHPSGNMCATSSHDGTCKIWSFEDTKWVCESCVTYRGLPCNNAAFSEDGSMLATAFCGSVMLCDPNNADQLMLLTSQKDDVRSIKFGRESCSRYLIVLSVDLQCWDILTGTLSWSSDVQGGHHLVSDRFSSNMALFTKSNSVFVFSPDQNVPKFSYDLEFQVVAACFVPKATGKLDWSRHSQLYMISDKMTVHTFSCGDEQENAIVASQSETQSPHSTILPSSRAVSTKSESNEIMSLQPKTKQEALSLIVDTPTHVLAPMKTICQQFISALLLKENQAAAPSTITQSKESVLDEEETIAMETETIDYGLRVEPQDLDLEEFDFLVPVLGDLFEKLK